MSSNALNGGQGPDFMLEVAQAIDTAVGELVDALPGDAQLFVFSPHGMECNALDLNAMLFLPELLYRWSTGRAALAQGDARVRPPAARTDYSRHWREEVWALRTAHGNDVLESPAEQGSRGDPLDWDPGNWYRSQWHAMRAFVLPGYSEGLVRLNVAGRDGPAGIAPQDFDRACEELSEMIGALVDARSGKPIVAGVARVRKAPQDEVAASAADLIVSWNEDIGTDVVDHPVHGRIGPVPFFRTGGHSTDGFVLARGAGFTPGVRLAPITTPDFTATLLSQLGVAIPPHVRGRRMGAQEQ